MGTEYSLGGISEVFPANTMKVYKGSRGAAPLILNLDNRWQ